MIDVLAIVTFAGSAALSIGTIAVAVGPQCRRIARLAAGHIEPAPEVAA